MNAAAIAAPARAAALALAAAVAALAGCGQARNSQSASTQIYINTEPPGAILSVDGTAAGVSPRTLPLPPGQHLVVVRKEGFIEKRATLDVEPGRRMALELKLEPVTGLVIAHSSPDGAEVDLDDAHCGKTPLLIPNFPLGRHRLRFTAPGYLPRTIEVEVQDRTPQKVFASLSPDSGRLVIASQPPGAQVTLDGAGNYRTPCEINKVTKGAHKLELSLPGYVTATSEVFLNAGDERRVNVTLKPLPSFINVVSEPPGAKIYVDDQLAGNAPVRVQAKPGNHAIRAELRGFDAASATVDMKAGEQTTVELKLVKNSGILILTTKPGGVSVFIDGEPVGETKATTEEGPSEPLQIDLLPQGTRRLQLSRKGYFDVTKDITITANQALTLNEPLKKRPVPFEPDVLIRAGPTQAETYTGIIRERYPNGEVRVETWPGVFRTFKMSDVTIEPLKPGASITNAPAKGSSQPPAAPQRAPAAPQPSILPQAQSSSNSSEKAPVQ